MQARLYLRTRTAVLAIRLCCAPVAALALCLAFCLASVRPAAAQTVSTTTVTGTVYLANGAPGSGTLQISWPAFTTAGGQAIAAGRTSASIGADGFVSLKLAPNVGAAPAGLFYTAVYHLKDGSTSTEYWVVPAAAQATIGQIRAQVMPAAQAVQAVSKTYVDQSISQAIHSQITPSGGTLTGPLFLDGDPSQPNQAATKHYVDGVAAQDLSLGGGVMTGPIVMAGDPTDSTQAANKHYVDGVAAQDLSLGGGVMTGAIVMAGDPTDSTQAANKHYVDQSVATALPLSGGILSGAVTATQIGALVQADQLAGVDFGAKLQACISRLDATYGGTCDARNFTGTLAMGANLTVSTPNATIYLPCATIATASSIVVSAGTRNVTFHGCASRGASAASGSQGGTVFLYSGSSPLLQVGDKTYATDTNGFHADNLAINTTAATAATAKAIIAWRTQELTLSSLYLLGNGNQTAITLNGTGNYTGGTFSDIQLTGFQTGINGIGHQASNSATTDWVNASTFLRLHIVCPTSDGDPIAGTTGINLQAGDGNTFTGGDVESCATALHLGASAQNNTLVGVRNENSTTQVLADAGSAYNSWITGGTMFDGKLVDNGTRNSFLDTYHRSFNSLNGDWYGSQHSRGRRA